MGLSKEYKLVSNPGTWPWRPLTADMTKHTKKKKAQVLLAVT